LKGDKMAKRQKGACDTCHKPVYDLTGKDIPDHLKGFGAMVSDYVIMDYPARKIFRCNHCYSKNECIRRQ